MDTFDLLRVKVPKEKFAEVWECIREKTKDTSRPCGVIEVESDSEKAEDIAEEIISLQEKILDLLK